VSTRARVVLFRNQHLLDKFPLKLLETNFGPQV
jgi:hypothetical protein